jgi:FkbM family methyltransferase
VRSAGTLSRVGRVRDMYEGLSADERDRMLELLQAPERMDYEPAEIVLRHSARKTRLRLTSAAKEPWTTEWIESFSAGDVCYDVGANVGAYSLIAAKRHGGAVTVVAFEPSAPSYHDLCVNIALNGCDDVITPLPVALWSETTLIPFGHYTLEPGTSRHTFEPNGEVGRRPVFSQRLLALSVDDAVRLLRLPPPTHLKIDTDGGEGPVLEGAQQTLAGPECRSVLIEVDVGQDAAKLSALLEPHGFVLARTFGTGKEGRVTYNLYARSN